MLFEDNSNATTSQTAHDIPADLREIEHTFHRQGSSHRRASDVTTPQRTPGKQADRLPYKGRSKKKDISGSSATENNHMSGAEEIFELQPSPSIVNAKRKNWNPDVPEDENAAKKKGAGNSQFREPAARTNQPDASEHLTDYQLPSDDETNLLFSALSHEKSTRENQPSKRDTDSASVATSRSAKGRRYGAQSKTSRRNTQPTVDDLLKMAPEKVRGCGITRETVMLVVRLSSGNKNRIWEHLMSQITVAREQDMDASTTRTATDRLKIKEGTCLFAERRSEFGYDMQDIQERPEFRKCSLFEALSPKTFRKTECLDIVFRKALKDIALEFDSHYDPNGLNTLKSPVFISARYLELGLLKKIRAAYLNLKLGDIIEYWTAPHMNHNPDLETAVKGERCEYYLRHLLERYRLRKEDFDGLTVESMGLEEMRVWTNKSTVSKWAITLTSYMNKIYDKIERERSTADTRDGAGDESLELDFVNCVTDSMKNIIRDNNTFFSELLKTSELIAWMCFGITTNDSDAGFLNMAFSFYWLRRGTPGVLDADQLTWNYPLASLHKRQTPSNTQPLVKSILSWWTNARAALISDSTTYRNESNAPAENLQPEHRSIQPSPAPVLYAGGAVLPIGSPQRELYSKGISRSSQVFETEFQSTPNPLLLQSPRSRNTES